MDALTKLGSTVCTYYMAGLICKSRGYDRGNPLIDGARSASVFVYCRLCSLLRDNGG